MRKSLVLLLASLTLALGLCPAFAFATQLQGGGLQILEDVPTYTVYVANSDGSVDSPTSGAYVAYKTGIQEASQFDLPTYTESAQWAFDGWAYEVKSDATATPTATGEIAKGTEKYAMTAGNLYLSGKWKKQSYDVTFKDGADTLATETYEYGHVLKAGDLPVKPGKKVAKFTLNKTSYTVASDATADTVISGASIDGKDTVEITEWAGVKSYSVTFDANLQDGMDKTAGKYAAADAQTLAFEEKTLSSGATNPNYKASVKLNAVPAGWTKQAAKDGFAFTGWKDADGKTYADMADLGASDSFSKDIVLKAQWKKVYTVHFIAEPYADNFDVTYDRKDVATDTVKVAEPEMAKVDGVELKGWIKGDDDYKGKFDFSKTYPVKETATENGLFIKTADGENLNYEITLTADWKANEYAVDFTVVTFGGKLAVDSQKVSYNTKIDNSKVVVKLAEPTGDAVKDAAALAEITKGYTQDSQLYTDEACKTKFDGSAIKADTKLYLQYKPNEYTIHFEPGDNATPIEGKEALKDITKVKYDAEVTLPANPYEKANNTFAGWQLFINNEAVIEDGAVVIYDDGATVKNLTDVKNGIATLKAVWQASYMIKFNGGDKSVVTVNGVKQTGDNEHVYTQYVKEGTKATLTKAADMVMTRPGYKFVEWNTVEEPTTANPGKVYADGAEFDGSKAAQGTVALTVYAIWAPETYTISYDANAPAGTTATGTAPASQSLTRDAYVLDNGGKATTTHTSAAIAKNPFTIEGYEFVNWSNTPDGKDIMDSKGKTVVTKAVFYDPEELIYSDTVTENITLYAQWKLTNVYAYYVDETAAAINSDGTVTLLKGKKYPNKMTEVMEFGAAGQSFKLANVPVVRVGYTADGWVAYKATKDGKYIGKSGEVLENVEFVDGKWVGRYYDSHDKEWYSYDEAVEVAKYAEGQEVKSTDLSQCVMLNVNWVPKTYTIEFYDEDKTTLLGSQKVAYNEAPIWSAAAPTKAADASNTYVFADFVDADGNDLGRYPYNYDEQNDKYVQSDKYVFYNTMEYLLNLGTLDNDDAVVKVYASYEAADQQYTVKFDANGAEAKGMPGEQKVFVGKTAIIPGADPTAEGYTFGGWFTDAACTTAADFAKAITADTTFYAKWTASEATAKAATDAADAFLAGAEVSAKGDGSDVATDKNWMTAEQKKAIEEAAKAVKDAGANATAAQIKALNDAIAAAQANGKGKDASKAAATDAEKAQGDQLLKDAAALQADVKAGKKTMAAADAKALQDAIDAYNAKKAAGTLTSGDVAALKAAVEKAQKAAKDVTPVAKKMKVDQKVKKIKATKGKKTVTKNVFAVSDAQGKVKVTVAKKFKKFVKAKANGKVVVTKKAKKGGKVKITITDGKTKQTIKVKVKLAKKK